jgi:hypothetical protein
MTSPEQGAQQECNKSLLAFAGNVSFSRISVIDDPKLRYFSYKTMLIL